MEQYASAIRVRDNQRRSRARRKSCVENLERKVQGYERQGIEVTLEMQHAARTVAVENSRHAFIGGLIECMPMFQPRSNRFHKGPLLDVLQSARLCVTPQTRG